ARPATTLVATVVVSGRTQPQHLAQRSDKAPGARVRQAENQMVSRVNWLSRVCATSTGGSAERSVRNLVEGVTSTGIHNTGATGLRVGTFTADAGAAWC